MKLHVQDADFYPSSKKQRLSKCFRGLGLLLRSALFASVVESGGEWWRVVERACQNRVVLLRGVPGSTDSSCNC
jgi:hypothetical protein